MTPRVRGDACSLDGEPAETSEKPLLDPIDEDSLGLGEGLRRGDPDKVEADASGIGLQLVGEGVSSVQRPSIPRTCALPCDLSRRPMGEGAVQSGVVAVLPHELVVASDLDNAPRLEHDDPIGRSNCREAMGDDDGRPVRE